MHWAPGNCPVGRSKIFEKVLIVVLIFDFSLQLIELVSDNRVFLFEKKWAGSHPKLPGPVLNANPPLSIAQLKAALLKKQVHKFFACSKTCSMDIQCLYI